MSFSIKDGLTGNVAKVDTNNKLTTQTTSQTQKNQSAASGDKYNINTGDITLTDATITSVLYLKNNEDDDLVITDLVYNLGATASGTGDIKIDVRRNPTAGTIITDAVATLVGAGVSANQNFGSNKSLAVDVFKGDTADNDFTNGDVTIATRSAANTGRISIDTTGDIVLPKGATLGISYTPPASNTSQIVQFALACYLRTATVQGS